MVAAVKWIKYLNWYFVFYTNVGRMTNILALSSVSQGGEGDKGRVESLSDYLKGTIFVVQTDHNSFSLAQQN